MPARWRAGNGWPLTTKETEQDPWKRTSTTPWQPRLATLTDLRPRKARTSKSIQARTRKSRPPVNPGWTRRCAGSASLATCRCPSIHRCSSASTPRSWTCSANSGPASPTTRDAGLIASGLIHSTDMKDPAGVAVIHSRSEDTRGTNNTWRTKSVRLPGNGPTKAPQSQTQGPRTRKMARRTRLDAELVRRGLARSRTQAADLIAAGQVSVAGQAAAKAATQVGQDAPITIKRADGEPEYASRGGHKLAGALAVFAGLTVAGRRCLDAGASTGGFTDVLLRAGAEHVVAVDVGYGQLAWNLRADARVTVLDRVNVRGLRPEQVGPAPEVVTADLSFISLTQVLGALVGCAAPDADFLLLVKPQFEVGKGQVGKGGVVTDPALRAGAVRAVARAAADDHGLGVRGVAASPLPGPAGNVEY